MRGAAPQCTGMRYLPPALAQDKPTSAIQAAPFCPGSRHAGFSCPPEVSKLMLCHLAGFHVALPQCMLVVMSGRLVMPAHGIAAETRLVPSQQVMTP